MRLGLPAASWKRLKERGHRSHYEIRSLPLALQCSCNALRTCPNRVQVRAKAHSAPVVPWFLFCCSPDMVGHTGDLAATTFACTLVDQCLKVGFSF